MRVLVTGGRNFADRPMLEAMLDNVHIERPISILIHGDASGADTLASKWAAQNGIEVLACPADWKRHGRSAGPIRNRQMLDHKPDQLVAFPGGKGTADMINAATKKGIGVKRG